ncbi:MAG: uracil-xanthine permease family protein [Firmicutes bacterium]|nr:uracil-xanthine permease family protein [Bacillota bacterium]MCL1954254.1 uracil-xanthine permease family protein [Bacillota bacterium]
MKFKGYSGVEVALGVQHLFAMFGATILVPILTGMNASVALLTAGLGTLIFHFVTKMRVPIFLGSSFAFLPGIAAVVASEGANYAGGAIIVAGGIYLIFSILVYFVGASNIKKLFPPVVVGPIVILIGLSLVGNGINDASAINQQGNSWAEYPWLSWLVAAFTLIVILLFMLRGKGIFKLVPILIGIVAGYVVCLILSAFGLNVLNFDAISAADWINIPYVTDGFMQLPKFSLSSILVIAPIAIVTFMEHIGDMTTLGAVTSKDIYQEPGLHRTVLGDGIATMAAGFFGGPANTSYGENIAVLATSKNFDPRIIRLAACFAIVLAFLGKFGALLQTIPSPVLGGVSIVLFGIIASCGIMVLVDNRVDFKNSRNLVITSLILSVGLGITLSGLGGYISISENFNLSGLFVATVVGILANICLPKDLPKIGDSDGNDETISGSDNEQFMNDGY